MTDHRSQFIIRPASTQIHLLLSLQYWSRNSNLHSKPNPAITTIEPDIFLSHNKNYSSIDKQTKMLRTQACISFMLLLAIRSEGFAPTTTPSTQGHQQIQRQRSRFAGSTATTSHQQQQQLSLKRSLPTSATSTSASLFNDPSSSAYNVNNRHSSNDYWYNIKTLPSSAILRDIRNPVLAVFGWSTAVSVLHFLLSRAANSSGLMATMATKMCVSPAAHSFLVSALGLLLVFRTNSAYQRFYVSSGVFVVS